jgi:glycosyltransferase involved in cell wall biosynthesis
MKGLESINCCVIIPTFNNDKTLGRVIQDVLKYTDENRLIVVNDGATDTTGQVLEQYNAGLTIIKNNINRGKGYSLRKAFRKAIELGFQNAITMDSDGQHFASDIPNFIVAAMENKGALIMGSRNMGQDGIPAKSSFGNKFSNFWFKIETGISLPDTQTGYRLYPLDEIDKLKLFTNKFELEIEVIVKLAWRNVPAVPIPVDVFYAQEGRVSHFRPIKDFARISVLNTYLVTLTVLYYFHKRVLGKILNKGLWTIIKEETIKPTESNFMKASSIGFGVFMGIVPIWGFQMLIGIPLSVVFRMNKVLFIAAANISIPPLIPLIILISYLFGGLFVENETDISSISEISIETIHLNFVQYTLGACVFAVVAGLVSYVFALVLFHKFRK